MAEKPRTQGAGGPVPSRTGRETAPTRPADDIGSTTITRELHSATASLPGQLAVDDRGNVSWEWSDNPELQADDVVGANARVRALAPTDLKLDEDDDGLAAVSKTPTTPRKSPPSGYNPYESGVPGKQSWKKKRDLREFSKWIELKKRFRSKPDEG